MIAVKLFFFGQFGFDVAGVLRTALTGCMILAGIAAYDMYIYMCIHSHENAMLPIELKEQEFYSG